MESTKEKSMSLKKCQKKHNWNAKGEQRMKRWHRTAKNNETTIKDTHIGWNIRRRRKKERDNDRIFQN